MRKNLIVLPLAALALTACGSGDWGGDSHRGEYVGMCANKYTGEPLPNYECDTGLYARAVPYYMPWGAWHDSVEVHHHNYYTSGERLSGGSFSRPNNSSGDVRVRSASNPAKVTLYAKGKQAGVPIKMNQDAKKIGVVTREQKKAANSSFNSSNSSISKKTANTSPFGGGGSSSTIKRK